MRESGTRTLTVPGSEAASGISLPDEFVVAGSESVSVGGAALRAGIDYELDPRASSIDFLVAPPETALVTVFYRYLPFELEDVYRHAVLESLASLPPWLADGGELVGAATRPTPVPPSDLRIAGAKTFGIKMGSDRDPSLEQSLRLNVHGRITRDVEVNAYLSDQNTPLVPEGDTEELRALDRVLIEIEGESASATLGDVKLDIEGGSLFRIKRELKGAKGTASAGPFGLTLAGAQVDGEFATHTFRGVDGKQGPYLLVGKGGGTGAQVVAGSERVWVDGVRATRGRDNDYVIDYSTGQLEFTERRQITSDNEISVDYEYALSDFERAVYGGRGEIDVGDVAAVGVSFFRESDDEGAPLSTVLGDEETAVLAAAGDDPLLAHDAGIDSVGVGGDYDMTEDGHFVHAGADSGAYDLWFESYDGGDYDYDFENDRYVYVGEGNGDYRLGRSLPVPTDRILSALDARMVLPRGGSVEVEAALSAFDRNTLSDIDDDDNLGNAQVLDARLPEIEIGGEGGSSVGLGVRARRVAGSFESVGRFREVGYTERWELTGLELPAEELLLEAIATASLGGRTDLEISHAQLERGEAATSRKTEASLGARDLAGFRLRAAVRLVDLDHTSARRERALFTGSLERDVGFLTPGVAYRHDTRESAAPDGTSGERYDEYTASVRGGAATAFSFGGSYSLRLSDRLEADRWTSASTTRTQEYLVAFKGSETLSLEASATRRVTEFEPGFADPSTKYDVASVRAHHSSFGGALRGELRYSVTSTEVEEKERQVIIEDGVETTRILSTGRFYPVTDLSAGTRWELKPRSRRGTGRDLPDPSPFRRFLSAISLETDVKLSEVTTTGEKWRLYLLDPSVVRGDDTVRGEVSTRHVARYVAQDGTRSLRLALNTRDALDRSYTNSSEERTERAGTADLKLSPSGNVTYRVKGELAKREQRSEGTGYSYDVDERAVLFELTSKRLGNLEVKLTAEVRGTDEHLDRLAFTETTVTPALVYRLTGRGAVTASLSRVDLSTDADRIPVYLASGRRPGVSSEWRISADYRMNRFLTGSLNYTGERGPEETTRHTVDVRVNAFF